MRAWKWLRLVIANGGCQRRADGQVAFDAGVTTLRIGFHSLYALILEGFGSICEQLDAAEKVVRHHG